jgi:uncharacterized membrane protein
MTDEPKAKNEETKGAPHTFAEELNVAGNQLLERVQELIQQGNIRRLSIVDSSGRTLLEVPLTLGVVGGAGVAIFAPFIAAVGAIAALVTRVRIVIERYEDPADAKHESGPSVADVNKDEDKPQG